MRMAFHIAKVHFFCRNATKCQKILLTIRKLRLISEHAIRILFANHEVEAVLDVGLGGSRVEVDEEE